MAIQIGCRWRGLCCLFILSIVNAHSYPTRPVVLIPGMASTQLLAWKHQVCEGALGDGMYRDVQVGQRIWLDTSKVVSSPNCWMQCMKLHTVNQSDVGCRLRPAEGLPSISELDPGIFTGELSMVWRKLIQKLVEEFDLGPDKLFVASYDWRLPPMRLQTRDRYFSKLKRTFEEARCAKADAGAIVIAHSMGNNIFRYFLSWLEQDMGKKKALQWIEYHISAFFAIGAPLLGSMEPVECVVTGRTHGLPISVADARDLFVSFGSSLWILPMPGTKDGPESTEPVLSITVEDTGVFNASTRITKKTQKVRHYTVEHIRNGTLFRELSKYDHVFRDLERVREKYYENDPILNSLTPWGRPVGIKAVYAAYGIGKPTRVGYKYSVQLSSSSAFHAWKITDIIFENEQKTFECNKTGDSTVPYHSLSYAHTWLGDKNDEVNVTRIPQGVFFKDHQVQVNKLRRHGPDIHARYVFVPENGTKDDTIIETPSWCSIHFPRDFTSCTTSCEANGMFYGFWKSSTSKKYITFFESTVMDQGNGEEKHTSVWEMDGVGHREILGDNTFHRELILEMAQLFRGKHLSDKTSRPPAEHHHCYWDYPGAKCEYPEYCEYAYWLGDLTLDQSCRIKKKHQDRKKLGLEHENHPQSVFDEHENECPHCSNQIQRNDQYCNNPDRQHLFTILGKRQCVYSGNFKGKE